MPAPRDPVFRRRLISALILGPLAVVLLYVGDLAFTAWVAAFAAAMAWEWIHMSDRDAPPVAYAIACATASGTVLLAGQTSVMDALAWGAAGTLASGIERWRRGWSSEVLGVLYVSLSAALLAAMQAEPDHGLKAVILLFAVVWAADSLAYLVGTWIGGPKLLPQASPKRPGPVSWPASWPAPRQDWRRVICLASSRSACCHLLSLSPWPRSAAIWQCRCSNAVSGSRTQARSSPGMAGCWTGSMR